EHELEPDEVVGTGSGGRITRNDVLAAAANRRAAVAAPTTSTTSTASPPPQATAPTPRPTPTTAPPTASHPVPQAGADDDVVEFTKARRATAEHMVRSLATSAHTLVATEVDYHGVDPIRRAAKLSFLPFIARATIDALHEFPRVNSSVGDDELIVHR